MCRKAVYIFFVFSFLLVFTTSKAQELPKFKDRQTVCFVGNSITQSGMYHMLFQTFYATRYPGNKVNFINCGIGGDRANDMIARFKGDVLVHKPDYAFLMTGMNDMLTGLYLPGIVVNDELLLKRKKVHQKYRKQTTQLVQMMIDNGIKPILMTPSIYDETAELKKPAAIGKNDALEICSQHILELGKKNHIPVVDLNSFMLNINLKAQKEDPSFTIVGPDRVHPKTTGHFIMAYQMIHTLFPESVVSKVMVDARNRTIIDTQNATATFNSGNAISFQVLSKSLPFPITNSFKDAQNFIPFQEDMNRELLFVQRLEKGTYQLKIDQKVIALFSTKEFKKGINLANFTTTPQYQQAKKVLTLCKEYHQTQSRLRAIANVDFKRLRKYTGINTMEAKKRYLDAQNKKAKGKPWYYSGIKICKLYDQYKPVEHKVWQELEMLRAKIYSQNIPKEHTYSLHKMDL